MGEGEGRRLHRAFRVEGRVQGVGFRWWVRELAQDLRVTGYARNLPDGSVEVQASGAAASLERLEEALREGPPAARVEHVSPAALDLALPSGEFQIRRTF